MVLYRQLLRRVQAFLKEPQGFTLIEVMFAVGVLALVLCGIIALLVHCFVFVSISKSSNIAMSALLGLSEEIRSSSFAQIAETYDGLNFSVNDLAGSNRGVISVNDTNPEFLQVYMSVCWVQGNRVIGEDKNLNGSLDPGEDENGNNMIDSSVSLMTRIVNR
ncbi:MAG: prepilin-type N-terminal cleavage/methylation domain-containing protein [Candidatus Omnitrophica bacterium]|nr:prepilin-type N-terminal cleavage/methylation domain-containing protein [Candidatus Omnitrophota bacterium]